MAEELEHKLTKLRDYLLGMFVGSFSGYIVGEFFDKDFLESKIIFPLLGWSIGTLSVYVKYYKDRKSD